LTRLASKDEEEEEQDQQQQQRSFILDRKYTRRVQGACNCDFCKEGGAEGFNQRSDEATFYVYTTLKAYTRTHCACRDFWETSEAGCLLE